MDSLPKNRDQLFGNEGYEGEETGYRIVPSSRDRENSLSDHGGEGLKDLP